MKENEVLKDLQNYQGILKAKTRINVSVNPEIALNSITEAIEVIQQYRAIGTIEEFKALKEADMRGANRAVDEFANYLHKIAKENNGLRLSSETRSRTHPCIFDYLEEFKNEQTCKEET